MTAASTEPSMYLFVWMVSAGNQTQQSSLKNMLLFFLKNDKKTIISTLFFLQDRKSISLPIAT